MGDLSKNLSRHEMACRCGCGFDTVDIELVAVLQATCDRFAQALGVEKAVLVITGPNRCVKHNAKVGGAPGSYHIEAKAADFRIKGTTANEVADYLESTYPNEYGVGRYHNRTHVDVSRHKRRWDQRPK